MHKGTVDVGVRFTFYVDRISGLPPSSSPSMFSLGWAISKGLGRHRTGNTRHVVAAADGSVNFDGEALEVQRCCFWTALLHARRRRWTPPCIN